MYLFVDVSARALCVLVSERVYYVLVCGIPAPIPSLPSPNKKKSHAPVVCSLTVPYSYFTVHHVTLLTYATSPLPATS